MHSNYILAVLTVLDSAVDPMLTLGRPSDALDVTGIVEDCCIDVPACVRVATRFGGSWEVENSPEVRLAIACDSPTASTLLDRFLSCSF